MKSMKERRDQATELRKQAEELARTKAAQLPENQKAVSQEDISRLYHELQMHQIELEMQNEELRKAQTQLDISQARYFDLYDLAPVGYFTMNEQGLILEINLKASTLLGLARSTLVKQPLPHFILPEDQDIFYRLRKLLFETGAPQVCELRLVKKDADPFWVRIDSTLAKDTDGVPICRATMIDITERKHAGDALRESERENAFQAELLRNAPVIAAFHDRDQNIVWANKAYEEATGLSLQDIAGKKCYAVWNLSGPCQGCPVLTAMATGKTSEAELTPQNQENWLESQGSWLSKASPVRDEEGSIIGAIEIAIDITERKRLEARELLAKDVLTALNRPNNIKSIIRDILLLIKQQAGIEAVGIRLKEGEDFPYTKTNGFPDHFVELENQLCARDAAGRILRNDQGLPVLECMCGNVICGRTNPTLPFFTATGSFWSNCTTDLLASTTEAERQAHTRNRCNGEGYESVALIPLKAGDEIIGLLQLNDHRRNQFTLDQITFLEGLVASIGIAITRTRAEEKIKENISLLRIAGDKAKLGGWIVDLKNNLCTWSDETAAIHERPAGYAPLVEDGISYYAPEWREKITKVFTECAQNGIPYDEEMEIITANGKRVWVRTMGEPVKDEAGKIIKVQGAFQEITERKHAEEALRESEERFRSYLEYAPDGVYMSDMKGTFLYSNLKCEADVRQL